MEYKPSYADSLRADIQPSYSDSLYHHGILGMHWGVRRYQNSESSYTPEGKARRANESEPQLSSIDKKYDKLAKKDAKKFARAKMSTGEGAGNKRKLINAIVKQRRKENEHYNEAFDAYLEKQDMAKHANAAKRERAVKNAATSTRRGLNTTVRVLNTVSRFV